MKKKLFYWIIGLFGLILMVIGADLFCIFTRFKPLLAIQNEGGNVYKGIFYDTYLCSEYSVPQVKLKGTKFSCLAFETIELGDVVDIIDTSNENNEFGCAEVLEEFFEDNEMIYYFECEKSDYVIVRYESGYEEPLKDALKYGTITIEDLNRFSIDYLQYKKE